MAVPKRKTSKSCRNKRRANHFASVLQSSKCKSCGADCLNHMACSSCGQYKSIQVIKKKEKKEKNINQ